MRSDLLLDTADNYPKKDGKPVLCSMCMAMVEKRDWKENKVLWNCFPELLGIQVPGWGEFVVDAPAGPEAPARWTAGTT